MSKITTAMVFAAGLGTRMRPLTLTTPKPLIKLGGVTMLDRALAQLAQFGIERVVINSHYLADQISDHIHRIKPHYPPEIIVIHEPVLLETGGGLCNARQYLGDAPIFVINADCVWCDGDEMPPSLTNMAESFDSARMDGLLLLVRRDHATGYDGKGDFKLLDTAAASQITRRGSDDFAQYVFAGIHVLDPQRIEQDSPQNDIFSVNLIWDRILARHRLYGLVHLGQWFHVGTPEDLRIAEGMMKNGRSR